MSEMAKRARELAKHAPFYENGQQALRDCAAEIELLEATCESLTRQRDAVKDELAAVKRQRDQVDWALTCTMEEAEKEPTINTLAFSVLALRRMLATARKQASER
jgi:hypothetical protein